MHPNGKAFHQIGIILLTLVISQSAFCAVNDSSIPDSLLRRIITQAEIFPQEKIYLHHDKSVYITGEDIWFRAYKVDALNHVPELASRYIYVELVNPVDSVINRVKIRPEEGAWSGHLPLPEDLAEGTYTLRAYTRLMEGLGETYFFRKSVRIVTPMSALYRLEADFQEPDGGKNVQLRLSLTNVRTGEQITADQWQAFDNRGRVRTIKTAEDGYARTRVNRSDLTKSNLLIRYDLNGKFHTHYLPVPAPEGEFDVTFFPEGGNLIEEQINQVAYKVTNPDGLGGFVKIIIEDEPGNVIYSSESRHKGMGIFSFTPMGGTTYTVTCTDINGHKRTFTLPEALNNSHSLGTQWRNESLYVSLKSAEAVKGEPLYLTVHCRGDVVYSEPWDHSLPYIIFRQQDLPAGVNHIILSNNEYQPVSERLIFSNNLESAVAKVEKRDRKATFGTRDRVQTAIRLTNEADEPLYGSFSVAVTDDKDISPDSTVNILSYLLLSSDVKGYIEEPSWYFRDMDRYKTNLLDLLLMTQGWRRYNIERVLLGDPEPLPGEIELIPKISGRVRGGVLMNRGSAGYPVSLMVWNPFIYEIEETDENGRFVFRGIEMPDSTDYIIQGKTKRGGKRVELEIDEESFPAIKDVYPVQHLTETSSLEDYIQKADQKYTVENGIRMIYLQEVEVVAQAKKNESRSIYSSPFNKVVTSDEIEKNHYNTIYDLLRVQPGVNVSGTTVTIRGGGTPLIVIDDMPSEDADVLDGLPVFDVESVEIVKDGTAALFGSRGGNGAILITTKRGFDQRTNYSQSFNIKRTKPLGYQVKKEFYSPRYDVDETKDIHTPDLRTTIFWAPDVRTDEQGIAQLDFFSADTETTYSVVIEGITNNGKLIHHIDKIKITND